MQPVCIIHLTISFLFGLLPSCTLPVANAVTRYVGHEQRRTLEAWGPECTVPHVITSEPMMEARRRPHPRLPCLVWTSCVLLWNRTWELRVRIVYSLVGLHGAVYHIYAASRVRYTLGWCEAVQGIWQTWSEEGGQVRVCGGWRSLLYARFILSCCFIVLQFLCYCWTRSHLCRHLHHLCQSQSLPRCVCMYAVCQPVYTV